jgi:hypothetical protein
VSTTNTPELSASASLDEAAIALGQWLDSAAEYSDIEPALDAWSAQPIGLGCVIPRNGLDASYPGGANSEGALELWWLVAADAHTALAVVRVADEGDGGYWRVERVERTSEEARCPSNEWEQCSACDGHGCTVADDDDDCPQCNGTGEVAVRR